MAEAHRHRKTPERVRTRSIESARRLAQANGLRAVGMEAVAAEANIVKGGLLPHFPSKQALVDGAFQRSLEDSDADPEARMAADPASSGRFLRACVRSVRDVGAEARWRALRVAALTDPHLRRVREEWFNAQDSSCDETGLDFASARLAADGVRLGRMVGAAPDDPEAFEGRPVEMTRFQE